jgi:UPF0755 protein
VAKLVAGDVVQHRITFPEGLAASEVFAILAEKGFGKEAEYERLFVRPGLFPEIPTTAPSLEGFLFPDTYVLTRSLSPREIVTLFVRQLRRRLPRGFDDEIKGRGLSLLEAVTVASLVEKETALAEERSLVSAVYLNRLSRGMLLQCDPTTIYSLKRLGAFRGSPLQRDLSAPDPYNTYVHAGLPPGPICNPGLASLEAAARPAKSTYLFFVAAGDGSHRFASDGEAHGRNVALWRRTQRERGQARTVR